MENNYMLKNGLQLTVRQAVEDDAEAMIPVIQQFAYESKNKTWEPGEFSYTPEQEREFIRRANTTDRNTFVLGIIDDEIVSVANVSTSTRTRLQYVGEIGISVLKKYWHIGVGTAVMHFIIDWAGEVGLRKLNLSVRSDHKAGIALYEKVGFVREGLRTRTMCIDGEFVDTIDMGLQLD